MKERVVELLVLLMTEMQQNKQLTDIDFSDLRERGFTNAEISAAFSWINEHIPTERSHLQQTGPVQEGSRRLLHDAERVVFTTDSQGYLILLRELGLLDDPAMESVIERAMMTGYEGLSISEVREIVAAVLFSKSITQTGTGRSMLNNEDSIH